MLAFRRFICGTWFWSKGSKFHTRQKGIPNSLQVGTWSSRMTSFVPIPPCVAMLSHRSLVDRDHLTGWKCLSEPCVSTWTFFWGMWQISSSLAFGYYAGCWPSKRLIKLLHLDLIISGCFPIGSQWHEWPKGSLHSCAGHSSQTFLHCSW